MAACLVAIVAVSLIAPPSRTTATDVGSIRTIGGTNDVGDGGPARNAYLPGIVALATDSSGRFIMANDDYRIRRIEHDGTLTVIAGNGGSTTTAPATGTAFTALPEILRIVGMSDGSLVAVARFSTAFGLGILRFDTAGNVDAPALTASSSFPGTLSGVAEALVVGAEGNVYYLDSFYGVVTKISPANVLSRVAGISSIPPSTGSGDGGLAVDATLAFPNALLVSGQEMFIVESYQRIRRVDAAGIISTISNELVAVGGSQSPIGQLGGRTADGSLVAINRSGLFSFNVGGPGIPIAGFGSLDPESSTDAASASFWPGSIVATITPTGEYFVAQTPNNLVYRVTAVGSVERISGRFLDSGTSDRFPIRDARIVREPDGSMLVWSYAAAQTETVLRYRDGVVEKIGGAHRLGSSLELRDGFSADGVQLLSPSVAPGCAGSVYVTYPYTPPYLFRIDANRVAHEIRGPSVPPFTRYSYVAGTCGAAYAVRNGQLLRIHANDTATVFIPDFPYFVWMRSDDAGGLLAWNVTGLYRIESSGTISLLVNGSFDDAVSDQAGGLIVLRRPPFVGSQAVIERVAADGSSVVLAQNGPPSLPPLAVDGPLTSNRLRVRALAWEPGGSLVVLDGGLMRRLRVAPKTAAPQASAAPSTMARRGAPLVPPGTSSGGRQPAPQAG